MFFSQNKTAYFARKSSNISLMMFFIASLLSSVSNAEWVTLYGPETFYRSSGAPEVVNDTFTSPQDGLVCLIKVYNGSMEDGAYELVSSTVIEHNGTEIFSPNEFNQQVNYIEKPITVSLANTLDVELRSKPGGALTIVVECDGEGKSHPAITSTLTPQANAHGWNNGDVTVDFTCQASGAPIVSCPDPVLVASEGSNQEVSGTATDALKNTATASVAVNLDKTAPVINSTVSGGMWPDGWYYGEVTVTYTCDDTLSGIASCPDPIIVIDEGENSVTATAMDFADNQTSTSTVVRIRNNRPPVAHDQTVTTDEDISVSITAVGSDEDGDTLTYTLISGPSHGSLTGTAPNLTYTPNANYNGNDTVTFSVFDGTETSEPGTISIVINSVNDAPIITSTAIEEGVENTLYTYTVTANDIDHPDTELTYSLQQAPEGMTQVPATGQIQWQTNYESSGSHQVVVRVTDPLGGYDEQGFLLEIQNVNRPPVADDQTVTVDEDTSVSFTVLGSDEDGDSLTYTVISGPNHGTLTGTIPNLNYTPNADYNGSDTVSFSVFDGTESSEPGTIHIDIDSINDLPTITSTDMEEGVENTLYTYTVTANDVDHVSTELTYSLLQAPEGMTQDSATGLIQWQTDYQSSGFHRVVVRVTDPLGGYDEQEFLLEIQNVNRSPVISSSPVETHQKGNGDYLYSVVATDEDNEALTFELVQQPRGMSIDRLSGNILWAEGGMSPGTYPITIKVTDLYGGSDTQQFNLVVSLAPNNIPTFTSLPIIDTQEEDLYAYQSTAEDEDGDKLLFELLEGPAGLSIHPSSGLVSWQTNGKDNGSYPIQLKVSDGRGGFSVQGYTLNVADLPNNPPVISSQAIATSIVSELYSYDVEATDADNDLLTYSLVNAPEAFSINSETGLISGVLSSVGDYPLAVSVEDGKGGVDTQGFTVVVSEPPSNIPQFTTIPPTTVNEKALYEYDAETQLEGITNQTYSIVKAQEGTSLNDYSGVMQWKANSEFVQGSLLSNTGCVAENPIDLTPKQKWHWSSSEYYPSFNQVIATPVVAQLSDDNGDGEINNDDIPDVVFPAYEGDAYYAQGVLRAINGDTGEEIWSNSSTVRSAVAYYSPAIGDIDNDGLVEIVVGDGTEESPELVAYEHNGTEKWRVNVNALGHPYLADLNNDGLVEILVSGSVYDLSGNLQWSGNKDPYSLAVDMDQDGDLEIYAGGILYDHLGNVVWNSGINWNNSFAAFGNFDADDFPEIITRTGENEFAVIDNNGTLLRGPIQFAQGNPSQSNGGAFTVGNFDGDAAIEIGVATATHYLVYERDLSLKWAIDIDDDSDGHIGGVVFNFNGDREPEVVIADKSSLRVVNGATGNEIFSLPHSSHTLNEYPVVADVDGDGRSEILVVSNTVSGQGEGGVTVYEGIDDNWAPTRSIWNQYGYSVDNVNDDGTIPRLSDRGWLTHKGYRVNSLTDSIDNPVHIIETQYSEVAPPIYQKTKRAIKLGGEFVAPKAVAWHNEHSCLGCHIQTQSLYGLASSLNKADVDKVATEYLFHEIMSSQQEDGSIRRSNPEHSNTQTALALWALSAWPNANESYEVRKKALRFMYENRSGLYYNETDVGWLKNLYPVNAIMSQAYAKFIIDSYTVDNSFVDQDFLNVIKSDVSFLHKQFLGLYWYAHNSLDAAFYLIGLGELKPFITDPQDLERTRKEINTLRDYLRGHQLADGGWALSGNQGDPLVTAWVGFALEHTNPPTYDHWIYDGILFLLNSQQEDGSWSSNSKLFTQDTSGLSVTSLVMSYLPVALERVASWSSVINYRQPDLMATDLLYDENSKILSTQIFNRGYIRAEKVDVSFYNGNPQNSGVLIGTIELANIYANQKLTAQLEDILPDQLTDNIFVTVNENNSIPECTYDNNKAVGILGKIDVKNESGQGDQQTWLINVKDVNDPPEVNSTTTEYSLTEGETLRLYINAEDPDKGDTVSYELLNGPPGLTVDATSGRVTWYPDSDGAGAYDVTVRVKDLAGLYTDITLKVTVDDFVNTPPSITSSPNTEAFYNSLYEYQVVAVDAENNKLSYSFDEAPFGATINPDTGYVSWNTTYDADPSISITVRVEDEYGEFDTQTFEVNLIQGLDNCSVDSNSIQNLNYLDFADSSALQLNNHARIIQPENGAAFLRLSNATRSSSGSAFSLSPLSLVDSDGFNASFSTRFTFRMTNSGGSRDTDGLGADGIVFVLNTTSNTVGGSGVGIGYRGIPQSVGIEFDSWKNPFDPSGNHIGVDINGSVDSVATANIPQRFNDGDIWYAWIDYDGLTDNLSVRVSLNSERPIEPTLEYTINLVNILNSENAYVGFTSATGSAWNDHDILSWQFINTYAPNGECDQPYFTSIPLQLIEQGNLYQYQAQAETVASSYLTYSSTGTTPTGMSIDPTTGLIQWQTDGDTALGDYPITIQAQSDAGLIAEQGYTLRVVASGRAAPIIQSQPLLSVMENADYTYTIVASDPENTGLVYSLEEGPAGMNVVGPSLVWTANANWESNQQLTTEIPVQLSVTNAYGLRDTQQYNLQVYRDPSDPNTSVTEPLYILSDPATSVYVGENYNYLVLTNLDSTHVLSYSLLVAPAGMSISVDGVVNWSNISSGDADIHDVKIKVSLDDGSYATQSYQLSVIDFGNNISNPPNILSTPPLSGFVDQLYSYQVSAIDPEGHDFSFTLQAAPTGMIIDSVTGLLEWTPTADQLGEHAVTLRVEDIYGAYREQSYTVTVIQEQGNQAPTIKSTPSQNVTAGETYNYQVTAIDLDYDPLTFYLVAAPLGMSIDPSTGLVTWQPQENQVGSHNVSIRVFDDKSAFSTQTYSLQVNELATANHAPQITSTPAFTVRDSDAYTYQILATDADGDTLSYNLTSSLTGMTLDSTTGLLSWPAEANQPGNYLIAISVTDEHGVESTQQWSLYVLENTAPVITSTPLLSTLLNDLYSYTVSAIDREGDAITYGLLNAPTGMSINAITGEITWTPANTDLGLHGVTVIATDGELTSQQTFNLTASASENNTAPSILSDPLYVAKALAPYQYDFEIQNDDGDPLQIQLLKAPAGMTLDAVNHRVSWTPDQITSAQVDLYVSDGVFSETQSWIINVIDAPLEAYITTSGVDFSEGDLVTVQVDYLNALGTPHFELTHDGAPVALDENLSAQITATGTGVHNLNLVATDNLEQVTDFTKYYVLDLSDTEFPIAEIHTPLDGSIHTEPADINITVNDDNLYQYTLLVSESDQNQWRPIFTGSANVDAQTVAQLDTTQLQNGSYDLRLEAEDINGQVSVVDSTLMVDGQLKLGQFSFTIEDLSIPVEGMPVRVTRTYDTRVSGKEAGLGYGWTLNYQDVKIEEDRDPSKQWATYKSDGDIYSVCVTPTVDHNVNIRLPNGDMESFELSFDNNCNTFYAPQEMTAVYKPIGNTQSTLRPLSQGTYDYDLENHHLRIIGNYLYNQLIGEFYNPNQYLLTTISGHEFILDQNFGIRQVKDRFNHTLNYSDDGIVHSSGKQVQFVRDSKDRVSQMIDPAGYITHYYYNAAGDLTSVEDPEGNTTRYTYDDRHRLITIDDPLGRKLIKNIYDEETGRLIGQEDNEGNYTSFDHNLEGRESIVTDRLKRTTVYYYDDRGNIESVVDANQGVTSYTYDDHDNQTSVTNPLDHTSYTTYDDDNNLRIQKDEEGNTTYFTYNQYGKELTITDPKKNVFTQEYKLGIALEKIIGPEPYSYVSSNVISSEGRVDSTTNALNDTTTYTYDSEGNRLSETNSEEEVTTYTYDENNNRLSESIKRTLVDGTIEVETTHYEYDGKNRLVKTIDPMDNVTRTEFDAAGNEAATINIYNERTEYEYDVYNRLTATHYHDSTSEYKTYDLEGNLKSETDRLDRTTYYDYDDLNRLVKTTYPDSSFTRTEYDAAGRVKAEIDGEDNRTEYEYDKAGRRTKVRNALLQEHTFTYDANGNLESETDANMHTTTYVYDELDRRVKTIFHDSSETVDTYDAMDRRTFMEDQADILTEYQYDTLGRLTKVIDALQGETKYTYDEAGNKLTQTDAENRTTHWTYDALGRVLSRELPLGQVETFTYDEGGNVETHTDFNGQLTTYTYDINHRVETITYDDGAEESFTYDAVGNRRSATNSWGTTYYDYDAMNRLEREEQPNGAILEYGYDKAGNKTSLTTTINGISTTVTYTYDDLNRLASVTDAEFNTTTYTYDSVGNRDSVSYPNGVTTSYEYDVLNRLKALETVDSNNVIQDRFDYTLTPSGRRERIDEADGRVTEYVYDDLYRLTHETITDPVNGNYVAEYQYDKVGNRSYSIIDGVHTQYDYDFNDRLTQQGGVHYTYDDNGNTLTETEDSDVTTYRYNAKNKLASVSKLVGGVATESSYAYNVDGIRVGQVLNGANTAYVVDSNQAYAQVLAELDDSESVVVEYLFGDDLINQARGGDIYYYGYDGLGSTRSLTDSSGLVTDSYDYEAFGELLGQSGNTDNVFRFTGEQLDENLGQYYLRARYYDPGRGRFTQMDEWMGKPCSPLTLNKYIYANVDPVYFTDPSGLMTLGSLMSGQAISNSIRGSFGAGRARAFKAYLKDLGEDMVCLAVEEIAGEAINQLITSGIYVLQDGPRNIYTGRTNDFDRRLYEHANDSKKQIVKTLARFHITDSENLRLIEQFFMDFLGEEEFDSPNNRRRAISHAKKNKDLNKMLKNLSFCK